MVQLDINAAVLIEEVCIRVKKMGKGYLSYAMAIHMKVNSKGPRDRAMECIYGDKTTDALTRGSGKMMLEKGTEKFNGTMAQDFKVNGLKVDFKAEYLYGQMDQSTQESSTYKPLI